MDWNSKEGRALLWKAYPEGYLAKRGVLTVGGWGCQNEIAGGNPDTGAGIFACASGRFTPARLWPDGVKDVVRLPTGACAAALARGDLLPNPDPSDVATWACLLADLWESSGRPPCAGLALCAPDNYYYENWFIVPGYAKSDPNYGYVDLPGLCYGDPKGWTRVEHIYPHFSGATLDPAEALVHARIMLRERP